MHADVVQKMAHATLAGDLPFPEIVGKLLTEGVAYYRIDYVARQMSFFSAAGSVVVAPLSFENLPEVAPDFDAPALQAAILDSQQNGPRPISLPSRRNTDSPSTTGCVWWASAGS